MTRILTDFVTGFVHSLLYLAISVAGLVWLL